MKLMFCMFADDIKLLPGNVFSRIMGAATKARMADANAAGRFAKLLQGLFKTGETGASLF